MFQAFGALALTILFAAQDSTLRGRVLDSTGAEIPGAEVRLSAQAAEWAETAVAGPDGVFFFTGLRPGRYLIRATTPRFLPAVRPIELSPAATHSIDLTLNVEPLSEEVLVSASRIASLPEWIPGSIGFVDARTLEASRVMTTNEALRKITGLHVREEEGFGLRPNVGIRGLNPTRSTKVLLLEDGIPLAYAPYGDNATYYHPPVDRFESIEVVKGAGQILYGPATVGGVINYVTPQPPPTAAGSVTLTAGSRDYFNGRANWGGSWNRHGILIDVLRKQGAGARDNQRFGLNDVNLKYTTAIGASHAVSVKAGYYGENSNVTYSGLREDEYQANPRQNPFRNDFFYGDRYGLDLIHTLVAGVRATITTSTYHHRFTRHWWRQSSNSNERPNDPTCGGMINLNSTCGIQGRLREYTTTGVEPRVRLNHRVAGWFEDTEFGFRIHTERQDRRQENGSRPTSRRGAVVEDNFRKNTAASTFLQNRFSFGRLAVTAGVRIERIAYRRTNRLGSAGAGVSGRSSLTEVIPGLGWSYGIGSDLTVFGGAHRGFAPPRTEDLITNLGGVIDLDPERSWNYETGVRGRLSRSVAIEATWFRMDYGNQVVPASLAGGIGALLTNGGRTRHEGMEFSSRIHTDDLLSRGIHAYVRASATWLPRAHFAGERYSSLPGGTGIRITGNRLPYAPAYMANLTLGLTRRSMDAMIEVVQTGPQFADDQNTRIPAASGQTGRIASNATLNATLNYTIEARRTTLFVTSKNLLDRTFIVDRSRGILPGQPRLIQAGLKFQF